MQAIATGRGSASSDSQRDSSIGIGGGSLVTGRHLAAPEPATATTSRHTPHHLPPRHSRQQRRRSPQQQLQIPQPQAPPQAPPRNPERMSAQKLAPYRRNANDRKRARSGWQYSVAAAPLAHVQPARSDLQHTRSSFLCSGSALHRTTLQLQLSPALSSPLLIAHISRRFRRSAGSTEAATARAHMMFAATWPVGC